MTSTARVWLSRWGPSMLALSLGTGLLFTDGYLTTLAGISLFGFALYAGGEPFRGLITALTPRNAGMADRLREWLPPVVLVGVAAGLLWPLLLGDMPYSHDHPVHLTRAWIFVDRMLFEGRLKGWTDIWFAGYPSGDDYPMGADLWVAALYLATFGLLGWVATYGLAFFAAYCVVGLSIYALGRVHFGRLAGFVAGLLMLTDAGSGLEGGWHYTVDAGVWPQAFGVAWTMLALASLPRLIRRGRGRDWALTAALVAYAILSHPFSVVWLGLALPSYLAMRTLFTTDDTFGATWIRPLGAAGLGVLLTAFWAVPFAAKSEWMHTAFGDMWLPLSEVAPRLANGTLFTAMFPPLFFVAGAGGVIAVYRRSFPGAWLVALGALATFLMARDFVVEPDLMEPFPGLGRLQYERFAYIGRPCIFLLAGYAVAALTRLGLPDTRRLPVGRRYAIALIVSAAFSPFVVPTMTHWWQGYRPGRGLLTTVDVPEWDAFQEFVDWSRAQRSNEPTFYRLGYADLGTDHILASAPVFNGIPAVRTDFTPAATFRFKPARFDLSLFEALNVKYVLSVRPLGAGFRELRRFGRLLLYRFEQYTPRRVTVVGPGEASVETMDPGRGEIRFRLRGTDASSRVVVHVANYPNWRANRNGRPIPIETAAIGSLNGFIGIAGGDGTVVLSFEPTTADYGGYALSLSAFIVLLLLAGARHLPARVIPNVVRVQSGLALLERHGRRIVVGLAAVPVAYVIGTFASQPPAAQRSFVSQLDRAHAGVATAAEERPCERTSAVRFQCGASEWNYVGRHYTWMMDEDGYHAGDGRMRRCIWMHADPDGELRLTFPNVTLGRALAGGHGLSNYGPRPMALVAYADGEELGRVPFHRVQRWTGWRIDTTARQGKEVDLSFGIHVPAMGPYQYCWNGRITP